MQPLIERNIRAAIGGDTQRILSMSPDYRNVTFKHVLLPLWLSAFKYRERVFRFLVNASTGEVQGERPWSWGKIALVAGGAAALIAALIALFGR